MSNKTTKCLRMLFLTVLFLNVNTLRAQCAYCNSFEDLMDNRWVQVDTIYNEVRSKNKQFWWGGNDYKFTTGDKETDKILKKDAFAVKRNDTLYVNCRNLTIEKARFGNGYAKAKRMGKHSLLFVNKINGVSTQRKAMTAGLVFGVVGSAIAAKNQIDQQVCYIISSGTKRGGDIRVRLINDALMDMIVANDENLKREYYSEEDREDRHLASHVIPILEKAGVFSQAKQKENSTN